MKSLEASASPEAGWGPSPWKYSSKLASKSNKTEMLRPMIWSLLLTPCSVTAYWYFIYAQLYVLRVDVIMNAIGIVFVAVELPFQLVAAFHFSTAIYI